MQDRESGRYQGGRERKESSKDGLFYFYFIFLGNKIPSLPLENVGFYIQEIIAIISPIITIFTLKIFAIHLVFLTLPLKLV